MKDTSFRKGFMVILIILASHSTVGCFPRNLYHGEDIDSGPDADINNETGSDADINVDTGADADADVDSDIDTDTDSDLDVDTDSDADTDIDTHIDTESCDGCLIGSQCYSDGDKNPSNICQVCNPSFSSINWRDNDGATCNVNGMCQSGECFCNTGWTNENCDVCADGYYGHACTSCTCINGTCDDSIKGKGTCTGSCNNGWEGENCDTCSLGYSGPLCTSCTCISGTCNDGLIGNGTCIGICDNGWEGENCDTCSEGYYGSTCALCTCINGTCDDSLSGNGTCVGSCDSGWEGENCDQCVHPDVVESCDAGLCKIPAGCFWMGSPEDERGHESDENLHYVQITRPFLMMSTEVAQQQFEELMGWNPSYFGPNYGGGNCGNDCPVESVSWYDTLAYANRLSELKELTSCYVFSNVECKEEAGTDTDTDTDTDYMACMNTNQKGIKNATVVLNGVSSVYNCDGYRLPTESEWEYAARAGSSSAFYNGDITYPSREPLDPNLDIIGWYGGNSTAAYSNFDCGETNCGPQPVRGKEPNSWGLYDMSGNVYEWTWDWYQSTYPTGDYTTPLVDPEGPASTSTHERVLRGGLWLGYATTCRSAKRLGFYTPSYSDSGCGFRLSMSN
ncbi:MAG: formylglycine-generating enzyme family protein [Proteobacteria bacterium]|nr:formylglycine-generating enzyme family protein [Pseudomonadota bacterium]